MNENAELRADVKFLMDQNSILTENVPIKSTNGNHEQQAELSTNINQRGILTPKVSNLITSVNELAIKNFEMLKMSRISGNNLGLYRMWSHEKCLVLILSGMEPPLEELFRF